MVSSLQTHRLFAGLCLGWLALDQLTKHLALALLTPGTPAPFLGEAVRFTLTFNRGAAMGLSLGPWSRPVFIAIGITMLVLLWSVYRTQRADQRFRIGLLAVITGGAIGNLIDRLRWSQGVVDFIDLGSGTARFWTFNVADVGISVGAVLLALQWSRGEGGTGQPGD